MQTNATSTLRDTPFTFGKYGKGGKQLQVHLKGLEKKLIFVTAIHIWNPEAEFD